MRRVTILSTALCLFWAGNALADDPDVSALIQALSGDDAAAAVDQLGELGSKAREAVPALIKLLDNDDVELRAKVVATLGEIGGSRRKVVAALETQLTSESETIRYRAAVAIGRQGPAGQVAVEALVSAAFDESAKVRHAVRDALEATEVSRDIILPLMIKSLEQADPATLQSALDMLAEQGAAAVPKLCDALEHPEACFYACLVLAEIGEDAAEATPALTKVVETGEVETRLHALIALGQIGPAAKAAVPSIIAAGSSDKDLMTASVFALGRVGVCTTEGLALAKAAAGAEEPFQKLVGTWAVVQLQPEDSAAHIAAVRLAAAALQSDDEDMVTAGARALITMDPVREIVTPVLEKVLKTGKPSTVDLLMDTVASFGADVVPRVVEGLDDEPMRLFAVGILARLGADAAEAVPALIAALDSDDDKYRREVLFTLGSIGPASAPAVDKLASLLDSANEDVAHAACYAIGKIGPSAKGAVPKLVEKFDSEDPALKLASIWAALKIVPVSDRLAARAVPSLITMLRDRREVLRAEAAGELGDIGKAATVALPELKKLERDKSPMVRKAAAAAIAKIEG